MLISLKCMGRLGEPKTQKGWNLGGRRLPAAGGKKARVASVGPSITNAIDAPHKKGALMKARPPFHHGGGRAIRAPQSMRATELRAAPTGNTLNPKP